MLEHATRQAAHADIFARVAPEAQYAQEEMFRKLAKGYEDRRKEWAEDAHLSDTATIQAGEHAGEKAFARAVERLQRQSERAKALTATLAVRDSRAAAAMTLQPVRDVTIDGIVVLSEDKQLDIIGPRYPDFWTSKGGDALPASQTVWANQGDGSFGFDHDVRGTVTGRQANSGAGVYVQFVPRIAPGIAEIRPYVPFSYQWSDLSFKSREDNSAKFGIRVWSWNSNGSDFTMEKDYTYFAWQNTTIASYFAEASSPSWEENQEDNVPGWDFDNAFLFGDEAPYFHTRPNRIYMAAIWCFGVCWSVSPENRPGASIAKLHARVPWVVIGYQ